MKSRLLQYSFTTLVISLVSEMVHGDKSLLQGKGYYIFYNNRTYYFDEHPAIRNDEQLCNISASLFFKSNYEDARNRNAVNHNILQYPNKTDAKTIIWTCHFLAEHCCGNTCCARQGIPGAIHKLILQTNWLYAAMVAFLFVIATFLCCFIILSFTSCLCCIYNQKKKSESEAMTMSAEAGEA
ncbi:hypothetical protein GCK32_012512 [Trichostrongylus colubriformis]|uniref:CX domain-containing protein n=1 Tax=Trichostrongylus colubriformis TaxID=6319 RepID=A0AAN8J2U7_TRICO